MQSRWRLRSRWFVALAVSFSLMALAIYSVQGLPDFNQLSRLNLLWLVWFLSGFVLSVSQYRALEALQREISAINLHAESLRDNAFNLAANPDQLRELLPVAQALRDMSESLQKERANLYQRELLLDTVLQTSPSALILTDEAGRVLLANPAARALLNKGKRFEGSSFAIILDTLPELKAALQLHQSLVFFEESGSIWHMSTSQFQLNQRRHCLYQLKPITQEIHQEEIKAWKKLLRVIGHELNNSLAPMSSLAYSGREQAEQTGANAFASIFSTISERCQHLNQFLQGYINFAKLPAPQRRPINWAQLINELQDHYEFDLIGDLPSKVWLLDQTQLAQLLLNLLKNAHEVGATATGTQLSLVEKPELLLIELQDDGGGMSEEVLSHALVPFYTTKEKGSGIGLTLCQDIVHGHGGRMELLNKSPGLLVRMYLPH